MRRNTRLIRSIVLSSRDAHTIVPPKLFLEARIQRTNSEEREETRDCNQDVVRRVNRPSQMDGVEEVRGDAWWRRRLWNPGHHLGGRGSCPARSHIQRLQDPHGKEVLGGADRSEELQPEWDPSPISVPSRLWSTSKNVIPINTNKTRNSSKQMRCHSPIKQPKGDAEFGAEEKATLV